MIKSKIAKVLPKGRKNCYLKSNKKVFGGTQKKLGKTAKFVLGVGVAGAVIQTAKGLKN